jgi:probable 2-oxoglutarate dehydrogenase E1 component DHKTD1
MANKFPQVKRYGLEGAESMLVSAGSRLYFTRFDAYRSSWMLCSKAHVHVLISDAHLLNDSHLTISVADISDVIVSMPHRGRLNLLSVMLEYPLEALFSKVKGNSEFPKDSRASGDVLSHLGKIPIIIRWLALKCI